MTVSEPKRILPVFLLLLSIWISQAVKAQELQYEKYFLLEEMDSIQQLAQQRIQSATASSVDYFWLSVSLDRQGKLMESILVLEEGNQRFPGLESGLELANKYYETGNYPRSRQLYISLLGENREVSRWIWNLAGIYEFENRYDSALYYLKLYHRQDTANYRTLVKIGENYSRLNQPDSAIQYLSRALEIIPSDYFTRRLLVSAFLQAEQYYPAIEICDHVLRTDSLNLNFTRLKAFAYYQLNNKDEASRYYKRVVQLGDSSVLTFKRLGLSLIETEEYDSAVNRFEYALTKDSLDHELYVGMGTALANTLEKTRSLPYFSRALQLMEPDTSVVAFIKENQANVYRVNISYEKALQLFLEVNEMKPGLPRILYSIGDLYMALDNYEAALLYFEELVAIVEKKNQLGNLRTELIYNLSKRNIRYIKEEKFFQGQD